jgi:hypothetical protein
MAWLAGSLPMGIQSLNWSASCDWHFFDVVADKHTCVVWISSTWWTAGSDMALQKMP